MVGGNSKGIVIYSLSRPKDISSKGNEKLELLDLECEFSGRFLPVNSQTGIS